MKNYSRYYERQTYSGCTCESCRKQVTSVSLEQDMRNLEKKKRIEKEIQRGFILSSATLAMMFSAGVAWAICAASKAGSFTSVFAGFALAAPLTICFIIMSVLTIAYWGDFVENGWRR